MRKTKKLTLNKETLKTLSAEELERINGGEPVPTGYDASCFANCYTQTTGSECNYWLVGTGA